MEIISRCLGMGQILNVREGTCGQTGWNFRAHPYQIKMKGGGGAEDKQAAAWVDMEIFKNPKRFYIWSANI